jgi:hypothetical protein
MLLFIFYLFYIMVFLHIDNSNRITNGVDLVKQLDSSLGKKLNKHFILFYMEGCGPCNATRPEWNKMKNVLSDSFLKRNDINIVSVDQILSDELSNVKSKPSSFPTMRYITNSGETVENYEDSTIADKSRTIDCFIDWIKLKTGEENITKSDKRHNKKTHKQKGGKTRRKTNRKWSLKYKKSINCKRPRGFSQRQYCKYGRK